MKAFIVLALVAVAAADVSHVIRNGASGAEKDAQTISQSSDVGVEGYQQAYQTSNGIQHTETGQLKNVGREDEALYVQGSSSYTAPDGTPIKLEFIADENGYQPVGAHLPTPPPTQAIPQDIARALQYIAAHPPPPESQVRSQVPKGQRGF